MYIDVYTHVYPHAHVLFCTHVHTHAYTHACMHVYAHVYVRVYTHVWPTGQVCSLVVAGAHPLVRQARAMRRQCLRTDVRIGTRIDMRAGMCGSISVHMYGHVCGHVRTSTSAVLCGSPHRTVLPHPALCYRAVPMPRRAGSYIDV